jgi:hypothetical protein
MPLSNASISALTGLTDPARPSGPGWRASEGESTPRTRVNSDERQLADLDRTAVRRMGVGLGCRLPRPVSLTERHCSTRSRRPACSSKDSATRLDPLLKVTILTPAA